jgi:type VI secretion system Hcp family effector
MPFTNPSLASRGLPFLAALGVSAALVAAGPVARAAAWKGYLQFEQIRGESVDKGHEGWINITAFSEGVQVPAPAPRSGGGSTTGAARWQPVTVTHVLDRASPPAYLAAANGRNLGKAVVELWPVTARATILLKLELGDVRITKVTTQGTSGTVPTEDLSLSFESLVANSLKIVGTINRGAPASLSPASPFLVTAGWPNTAATGSASDSDTTADTTAPWLGRNLLRNPGAEAEAEAEAGAGSGAPADWTPQGPFTTQTYGALPGLGGSPDHGTHLFAAGHADPSDPADSAAGTQMLDLTAAAQAIDAGQLQAVLAGWLGGTAGEQEAARLMALFRDATGAQLGTLGIASTPGEPALLRLEKAGLVPAGTRSIEVTLRFERTGQDEGQATAYADDLSLVLEEIAAASDLPVDIQLLRASGSLERARVRLSWTPRPGGVLVESADTLAGPWRTESGPTLLDAGREHFEVPASPDAPACFWRVRPASELR